MRGAYYGHRSWSETAEGNWDRHRLTCRQSRGSARGTNTVWLFGAAIISLYCDVGQSIVIVVLWILVLQNGKWVIVTSASLVDRLQ